MRKNLLVCILLMMSLNAWSDETQAVCGKKGKVCLVACSKNHVVNIQQCRADCVEHGLRCGDDILGSPQAPSAMANTSDAKPLGDPKMCLRKAKIACSSTCDKTYPGARYLNESKACIQECMEKAETGCETAQ